MNNVDTVIQKYVIDNDRLLYSDKAGVYLISFLFADESYGRIPMYVGDGESIAESLKATLDLFLSDTKTWNAIEKEDGKCLYLVELIGKTKSKSERLLLKNITIKKEKPLLQKYVHIVKQYKKDFENIDTPQI